MLCFCLFTALPYIGSWVYFVAAGRVVEPLFDAPTGARLLADEDDGAAILGRIFFDSRWLIDEWVFGYDLGE
ncbi:hypothetical protein J2751_002297 [Halorubrum alkaliphilum]|uniref:Uncharacterized protein n=1 Tax=Halorubrum alkaliphilum TaxID=261290 RepID=A0A8T4GFI1_9EURY|nr:hypothetical protein [Halorubrum alkaliphilum]